MNFMMVVKGEGETLLPSLYNPFHRGVVRHPRRHRDFSTSYRCHVESGEGRSRSRLSRVCHSAMERGEPRTSFAASMLIKINGKVVSLIR